ncbi:hypothetical protein FM106_09665 [Brachybacterium faecium]|nr:hypothetical protein FM106_09665 [Brachybacterium faecium]
MCFGLHKKQIKLFYNDMTPSIISVIKTIFQKIIMRRVLHFLF